MKFNIVGILFCFVNIALWIGIISIIIKKVKNVNHTFATINQIDKKVDSLLKKNSDIN